MSSFGYSGTIAHAVLEAAPPSLNSPSGAATTPLRYKRRRFAWREAAPSAEAAAASVEAAASSHSYVTEFVPLVAAPAAALPTLVLGARARPVISLPTAPLPLEAGAAAQSRKRKIGDDVSTTSARTRPSLDAVAASSSRPGSSSSSDRRRGDADRTRRPSWSMRARARGSDCDRAILGMGAAPAPQWAGCLSRQPPVRTTRAYHCDRVGFAHERQSARNKRSNLRSTRVLYLQGYFLLRSRAYSNPHDPTRRRGAHSSPRALPQR